MKSYLLNNSDEIEQNIGIVLKLIVATTSSKEFLLKAIKEMPIGRMYILHDSYIRIWNVLFERIPPPFDGFRKADLEFMLHGLKLVEQRKQDYFHRFRSYLEKLLSGFDGDYEGNDVGEYFQNRVDQESLSISDKGAFYQMIEDALISDSLKKMK